MMQFLKINKTKVAIIFSLMILSFIWEKMTSVLYGAIINKIGFENLEHCNENIFQISFLILLFIEFYLFTCLAVYLIKKDRGIILSFSELKQFLKINKTKIKIFFVFLALSFVWGIMTSVLYGVILDKAGFENIEYYMDHIFTIPFYILFILKFYLFACLAVYLVEKRERFK